MPPVGEGAANHLKVCPLHGIGPAGGRCGYSYIPLHIHSPKYCGAAPCEAWLLPSGWNWVGFPMAGKEVASPCTRLRSIR